MLGGYGFYAINNFKPFYGYDFLSLSGDSYVKASGTVDYEFLKKNHLNFSANIMSIADRLFQQPDWISNKKYAGFAIGYGMETIIGPLEIKYTWSPEHSRSYTWFSVGFAF